MSGFASDTDTEVAAPTSGAPRHVTAARRPITSSAPYYWMLHLEAFHARVRQCRRPRRPRGIRPLWCWASATTDVRRFPDVAAFIERTPGKRSSSQPGSGDAAKQPTGSAFRRNDGLQAERNSPFHLAGIAAAERAATKYFMGSPSSRRGGRHLARTLRGYGGSCSTSSGSSDRELRAGIDKDCS